jgi:glutamate/tyrosine decarboxylase-like PLP-dependent enzyme
VAADYRVDVGALEEAVRADRRAGVRPRGVVANAGTVNTGATDDLERIADLCAREGLWMHVDGAFGAMVRLEPSLHRLVRGLERADSLAFDLHKWGYFPIEAGCTLVRDADAHRAAFATEADYLAPVRGGIVARSPRMNQRGIQLSRGFRALKVWMGFLEHGTARYGAAIRRNVEQARALAERVRATPGLELMAPAPLNVVCFRYAGDGPARAVEADLDALNERILVRLQESGFAVPSHTRLGGRFALRVAITNHRTTEDDVFALAAETLRLGKELSA